MAYNELESLIVCPKCGEQTRALFQTKAAACFQLGYRMERYCLGSTMSWVTNDDPRYAGWRASDALVSVGDDAVEQACPGDCLSCDAQLGMIVRIASLRIVSTGPVFVETDWPETHPN